MANNRYCVIKWNTSKTSIKSLEFDVGQVELGSAMTNAEIQAQLKPKTSSNSFKDVLKVASNVAPTNNVPKIASSLNDIVRDGKFTTVELENITLQNLNPVFFNLSKKMGYNSFAELYTKIKVGGAALTDSEKELFTEYAKDASKEYSSQIQIKTNNNLQQQEGLLINIISNDTETYSSETPQKRTEDGFDLTSYVHNKNRTRSFSGIIADTTANVGYENPFGTVSLVNQQLTATQIKDLLVQIRNSKTTFNIEIENEGEITNCLFSSLSFTKTPSNGNSYEISFDVTPVVQGKIEVSKSKITGTSANSAQKAKDGNTESKEENSKQNQKVEDKKYQTAEILQVGSSISLTGDLIEGLSR